MRLRPQLQSKSSQLRATTGQPTCSHAPIEAVRHKLLLSHPPASELSSNQTQLVCQQDSFSNQINTGCTCFRHFSDALCSDNGPIQPGSPDSVFHFLSSSLFSCMVLQVILIQGTRSSDQFQPQSLPKSNKSTKKRALIPVLSIH